MEQGHTKKKFIPPPTGGWNARDPISAMPENDAIELVNYFPDAGTVMNRGGTLSVYTPFGTSAYGITSLMNLVDAAGNDKLVCIARESAASVMHAYRLDAGIWTDITPVGYGTLTWAPFNWCQFRNQIFAVNVGCTPLNIQTSGVATALSVSCAGLTITNLANVSSYRGSLYFLEDGSAKLYWLPTDYVSGALYVQDMQSLLTKGGYLMAHGEATKQSDATNQNVSFLVSSQGEILVFQGANPFAPSWSLIGRYFVGKPLGRRCIFYRGMDAHILTTEGIIPLNNLLNKIMQLDANGNSTGAYQVTTDKIKNAWANALNNYPIDSVYTWKAIYAPTYKLLLIQPSLFQVPFSQQGYVAPHFVQNTQTGQWCNFDSIDANEWVLCNDILYFIPTPGSAFASPKQIYKMEKPGTTYNMDQAQQIQPHQSRCRMAFNFLDNYSDNKHLTGVKAFFTLTAVAGHSTNENYRNVSLGANTDFNQDFNYDRIILNSITPNGTVDYSQVNQVAAQGSSFSILFLSAFGGGYSINWNGFIVDYEVGGFES